MCGGGTIFKRGSHTLNQVFLLTSLRAAARPADREHPFGLGKVRPGRLTGPVPDV
jgi:hypothetical protein